MIMMAMTNYDDDIYAHKKHRYLKSFEFLHGCQSILQREKYFKNGVDLVVCVTVVLSLKWLPVPIMTSQGKTTAQKFLKPSHCVKISLVRPRSGHEDISDHFHYTIFLAHLKYLL